MKTRDGHQIRAQTPLDIFTPHSSARAICEPTKRCHEYLLLIDLGDVNGKYEYGMTRLAGYYEMRDLEPQNI
jgi:hypothetical protein